MNAVTANYTNHPLEAQASLNSSRAQEILGNESNVTSLLFSVSVVTGITLLGLVAVTVATVAVLILTPPTSLIIPIAIPLICTLGPLLIFVAGFGLGEATYLLLNSRSIYVHFSYDGADTPEKVATVAAKIKNDTILSLTAEKMNFHQIEQLKAKISPRRFKRIIKKIDRCNNPALKAWQQLIAFEETNDKAAHFKLIKNEGLDHSPSFVKNLREMYPETDLNIGFEIPWARSENAIVKTRVMLKHKENTLEIPLEGYKDSLLRDSISDGVIKIIYESKEPAENINSVDFHEIKELFAFAMGEKAFINLIEYQFLVKTADKWSQDILLKKLNWLYKQQPVLSQEDGESLSHIPEMNDLINVHSSS